MKIKKETRSITTFSSALTVSGLDLTFLSRRPETQIVNFGCGEFKEAPDLISHIPDVRSIRIHGVDIRDSALADAETNVRHACEYHNRPAAIALHNVARDPERVMPDYIDLAVFRHQNLWFDERQWTHLFAMALDRLSPEGSIFVTSYFAEEHKLMLSRFRSLGAPSIVHGINPLQRWVERPDKRVDGYWALISRSTGSE